MVDGDEVSILVNAQSLKPPKEGTNIIIIFLSKHQLKVHGKQNRILNILRLVVGLVRLKNIIKMIFGCIDIHANAEHWQDTEREERRRETNSFC